MGLENFNLRQFIDFARQIGSDTSEVEVKTAAMALSKDVVETLSAFANKSGGYLICGISEKDGFHPVEGFNARKAADALAHACDDKMEPPIRADIEIEEFEGTLVVVAHIPETAPYSKPCYVKAKGLYDGSFIRTGEGDRKLSRYEVDRLTEERVQPKFDAEIVEDATIDDLDGELIAGFLRRERAASPRIFAGLSDNDALLTMGVLAKTENGNSLKPTLAGVMALGRHPQQFFPRANITFAVFPGANKEEVTEEGVRFLDSRTIIGPIPVMVSEALASVRRNMKITSFVEGVARRDVSEYPELAVREAVANALMHRDYSSEGLGSQVQVNMFSDRIEIINPGGLYGMVTVDNIGKYGASSSRNQYLSRILESTPYPSDVVENGYVVENKGTGFAQMQASLKAQGMPAAEPKDSLSMFEVVMCKGNRAQQEILTVNSAESKAVEEMKILDLLRFSSPLSSSDIADALGTSNTTAYRYLKKLVDEGEIQRVGSGRSTRYVKA